MGDLLMRVFTHPACSSCSTAVRRAWNLTQAHPEIELRTVNLVDAEGLKEAQAEGIKTIPTIIVSSAKGELRRLVGTPARHDLEAVAQVFSSRA